MKKSLFFALLLMLLFSAINSNTQEKTAAHPASAGREPMLVTVDWLADHLNDPSLVLLQIGDKKDYDKGHIPRAQFLEYESISTPHNHGVTLMPELPPVEQLVSVFERLGVSNRSHIILYFVTNWVSPTTRVYWTLDYLGVVEQENNQFKSGDALKELFRAAGLKQGNLMVTSCHIGQRATVLYFTAKMLGYDAKMYAGSWEDWSHRQDLPIVTGESPNKQ